MNSCNSSKRLSVALETFGLHCAFRRNCCTPRQRLSIGATVKKCSRCKQLKTFSEFSKHSDYKDGLEYKCRRCCSANYRSWRDRNPAKYQEKAKRSRDNPSFSTQSHKAWVQRNPEKKKAEQKLNNTLRNGSIVRPSVCSRCLASGCRIDAHHPDYSKPLEVVWLCRPCHGYVRRK